MQIRQMQSQDMERVCEIERQSFSKPWSRESFEKAYTNPSNIYLIIEKENQILGYCGIWMAADQGDLCHIAVAREARKKGCGALLLQAALEKCKKMGGSSLFLEVRASNVAAIKLYQKLGFQEIGVRPMYYSEPKEDGILMECQF